MATTTPNYAWVVPTSSDLVKNGATAIETLGDSADASLWNSGFGQAGKNKIINGDFSVNQYGLNSTGIAYPTACAIDRWTAAASGATGVVSLQAFTAGSAPVAGYESTSFLRMTTTVGNDFNRLLQRIESVRTFAGQTATLSFWAKGTNPTTAGKLNVRLKQYFGSGGSADVDSAEQNLTLTANWVRYSYTFVVPSIAGKTIGASNFVEVAIGQLSNASAESWTLDIWGVQMEYGSYATPFQTATGTIQGELAACQRYYYRQTSGSAYGWMAYGGCQNTTNGQAGLVLPVQMRVVPTALEYANVRIVDSSYAGSLTTLALNTGESTPNLADIYVTGSGITGGRPLYIGANNNTGAYLAVTAEL